MMRMFLKIFIKYKYNFARMKYLKKYNESIRSVQTVTDFCVNHLAYLLDDDSYRIEVTQEFGSVWHGTTPSYIFSLHRIYNGAYDIINWEEVKDNLIPFLHMLIREYNIEEVDKQGYDRSGLGNLSIYGNYDEISPRDRTIYFSEYKSYSSRQHYMNVDEVIKDQEVPEKFYRMIIKFY